LLLSAVEESVGGGASSVFMLLLVSEEEHRHTDRNMHISGDVSENDNVIRSTTC
jgi:hypothetical protein